MVYRNNCIIFLWFPLVVLIYEGYVLLYHFGRKLSPVFFGEPGEFFLAWFNLRLSCTTHRPTFHGRQSQRTSCGLDELHWELSPLIFLFYFFVFFVFWSFYRLVESCDIYYGCMLKQGQLRTHLLFLLWNLGMVTYQGRSLWTTHPFESWKLIADHLVCM